MDLAPSPDQAAVLDAIDALAQPFRELPPGFHGFHLYSPALDKALAEGGFLDVAAVPELGPVTAVLLVERICALPHCAEVAASALVRAVLAPELPRPFCLIDAGKEGLPVRFLPQAATALVIEGDAVRWIAPGHVEPLSSLFSYPMGRLADGIPRGETLAVKADALRRCWRIAIAAEIVGLLQGAIDSTIRHVSEREQFGRPIGKFQAVRHRLAEASVRASGSRLLARKAAFTGDAGDAALACLQAQDAATATLYDLHQFLGAMGITLEHPLHLWTYRIKALLAELGGRSAQIAAASDALGPLGRESGPVPYQQDRP